MRCRCGWFDPIFSPVSIASGYVNEDGTAFRVETAFGGQRTVKRAETGVSAVPAQRKSDETPSYFFLK
jgi:hypothetical protein